MQFQISPDVLAAPLAGETVLLDMRTRNYFRLNATAARTWASLEQGRSMEELLEDLERHFAAPRDVMEAETRELIGALRSRGLIVEAT